MVTVSTSLSVRKERAAWRASGHRMRRRAQGPAQLSFCRHEGAKTEAKRQGQISTWGRTAWLAAENGFRAGADKPQPAGP